MNQISPIIALAAFVSTNAQAASWSPDGKRVAFSYIGGPEAIYIIDADGSNLKAIVEREQRDFLPR